MPPRVLLLELNSELRTDYRDALEDDGYEVRTASDTTGAVAAIREGWPDVAVLNLTSPSVDAVTLLWEIAALERPMPVVISSTPAARDGDMMAWIGEDLREGSEEVRYLAERVTDALTAGPSPQPPRAA